MILILFKFWDKYKRLILEIMHNTKEEKISKNQECLNHIKQHIDKIDFIVRVFQILSLLEM